VRCRVRITLGGVQRISDDKASTGRLRHTHVPDDMGQFMHDDLAPRTGR
jgi:hypothetical protein